MKLSVEKQALAEGHLLGMVGSVIGVALLAADDLEGTKANLHASIENYPTALRDIAGESRTYLLMDATRQVRTSSREFYRVLEEVAASKAAEAGLSPEEARAAAVDAIGRAAAEALGAEGASTPEEALQEPQESPGA